MSLIAMEQRINILSKTSPTALTASETSYRRRPQIVLDNNHLCKVQTKHSSFETLTPWSPPPLPPPSSSSSSSGYRPRRRWSRAASTPPVPNQQHPNSKTFPKSNSTRRSSDASSTPVVVEADYIQTVFPPGLKNNQPDMDLAMFTQIAEITDCLYLSAAAAVRLDRMRQRMITHIINCTLDVPNFKAPNIECINIQVDDSSRAHLGIYFDRCADLIRQVSHKGGRVLVHCVAGISRSASLCIAYLMKYERMRLDQAYRHVKRKRPVIHPNVGFWRQLIDYEKRIFGSTSVKMVHSNMGMIPDVYAEEVRPIAAVALPRHSRFR